MAGGAGMLAGAVLAAGSAAHAQGQPPQVQVEHAAVRLVVIAEPRSDVAVAVAHGPSRLPPLSVRREGGRIVVDGGLERPFGVGPGRAECRGGPPGNRSVQVAGFGRIVYADLPVVTARVPLDARVSTAGAVYGQVGAARSLDLAAAGCGDWTLGPIQGRLGVDLAGSGDVEATDVGRLQARIAGSGDLRVRRAISGADAVVAGSGELRADLIGGGLRAVVGGSGGVEANAVEGPIQAVLSGSGDVRVKSGHAPKVEVSTQGSAGFDFGGEAGAVQAATSGSGDVRIAHARGTVSQSKSGSGSIEIGR